MFAFTTSKLPYEFYQQDVFIVAKNLLGKVFVKNGLNSLTAGIISEVEVYTVDDPASHSFIGKKNKNSVMFNGGGNLYVYFTYGMYYCCNIVTGKLNEGSAILIRALEPIEGINIIAERRYGKVDITEKEKYNLLNGPGKLSIGMDINMQYNGLSLQNEIIFISDYKTIDEKCIGVSARIGISQAKELQRRFFIKGSKFLSRNEKK